MRERLDDDEAALRRLVRIVRFDNRLANYYYHYYCSQFEFVCVRATTLS